MNKGKQFETDWENSYKGTSHYYMRLIDTAKWIQGAGSKFTPSNPCDAIQHTPPFLWLLELKSTEGASVSFFPNTPWERPKDTKTQKMIKPSQVKKLKKAVENTNIIAGFVINFRPRKLKSKETENVAYFIHITDFIEFAVKTRKASINEEDCKELGVQINCNKKKVHYSYDIIDFVDRAVIYYLTKGHLKEETLIKLKEWIENITGCLFV